MDKVGYHAVSEYTPYGMTIAIQKFMDEVKAMPSKDGFSIRWERIQMGVKGDVIFHIYHVYYDLWDDDEF